MKKYYNRFKAWLSSKWVAFKKWIARLGVAILALFGVSSVLAQDVSVSCTAPTEYTNDQPINPDEIKTFNFYRDNEPVIHVADVCLLVQSLTPATYTYRVSVTINGVESDLSNEVTRTVDFPKPKAPVIDAV